MKLIWILLILTLGRAQFLNADETKRIQISELKDVKIELFYMTTNHKMFKSVYEGNAPEVVVRNIKTMGHKITYENLPIEHTIFYKLNNLRMEKGSCDYCMIPYAVIDIYDGNSLIYEIVIYNENYATVNNQYFLIDRESPSTLGKILDRVTYD